MRASRWVMFSLFSMAAPRKVPGFGHRTAACHCFGCMIPPQLAADGPGRLVDKCPEALGARPDPAPDRLPDLWGQLRPDFLAKPVDGAGAALHRHRAGFYSGLFRRLGVPRAAALVWRVLGW